MYIDERILKVD